MPIQLIETPNELLASWMPDMSQDRALDIFLASLSQAEFLDWFALDDALEAFKTHLMTQPDLPIKKVIAQRKDAQYTLNTTDNALQARMFYSPAYGGKTLSIEDLKSLFQEQGYTFGIQPFIYQLISENPPQGHYLLAQGTAPIQGEDTQYQALVSEPETKGKPRLETGDKINFKDLQWITLVDKNTPLMKKTAPKEGTPGKSVFGEDIPAPPGQDLPFGEGKGAIVSPKDPNILLADKKGQIQIFDNHVTVLDVLEIENVDIKTGHINFPGTVIVKSNISEGFDVSSEGDVFVGGRIEGSRVTSHQEIFIQEGVVGQGKAVITAQELIQTRFIEQSTLKTRASVYIEDQILHSEVICGDFIRVGQAGSRGQVIGGKLIAKNKIHVQVAGSSAHTKTWLEVGECPFLSHQIEYLKTQYKTTQAKLESATKSLLFHRLKHRKSGMTEAIENLRTSLAIRLQEISDQLSSFDSQNRQNLHARIYVYEKIYPGVTVKIGPYFRTFHSGFSGATLYVDLIKNEIVVSSI